MSSKILKNIEFDLSKSGINHAIKEIEHFRTELKRQCLELAEKLTDEGVKIAKMQLAVMDAVYTGELEQGITGFFSPSLGAGFVYTDTYYAVYVEYGTGIVGDGTYPTATADGWQYDINNHGDEGWWYRNDKDGHCYWTKGYVARPFMLNTFEWLKEAAPEIAGRFWNEM